MNTGSNKTLIALMFALALLGEHVGSEGKLKYNGPGDAH